MNKVTWLHRICNMFNCPKQKKKVIHKGYLPISLFLVAGRFTNQEIDEMMSYGEKFIKELKY